MALGWCNQRLNITFPEVEDTSGSKSPRRDKPSRGLPSRISDCRCSYDTMTNASPDYAHAVHVASRSLAKLLNNLQRHHGL